ncbi:GRP family sugar transporter [Pseudopedobacter beijingensis]|uniref:GRP family sugar transporter n=1 Tax=Pseudopedobacter beijingensis TaxID=1207056 RepID=A0ABW4IAY4_9SPHI
MYIVHNYYQAVFFCIITMICWGSWANTQKLANKTWRYELYYWDYVLGIFLFSLISALTLGSFGNEGRSFMTDLGQAENKNIISALIGGVVFNAANILLSAAISIAGMSVAFPVGVGIALVLGVIINYIGMPVGDSYLLFGGVFLVTIAILLNAQAYKLKSAGTENTASSKGIIISIVAGILMAFFYRFIAASMDIENFTSPEAGKMTPYTAVFIFSIGILLSNIIFNTILIKKPFVGQPTSYKAYFSGSFGTHFTGILGGLIWGLGNSLNLIAAGKAGPAISYGLGQGATMIAALWGVFVWKEFKGADKNVKNKLALMFLFFIIGITLIIIAGQS